MANWIILKRFYIICYTSYKAQVNWEPAGPQSPCHHSPRRGYVEQILPSSLSLPGGISPLSRLSPAFSPLGVVASAWAGQGGRCWDRNTLEHRDSRVQCEQRPRQEAARTARLLRPPLQCLPPPSWQSRSEQAENVRMLTPSRSRGSHCGALLPVVSQCELPTPNGTSSHSKSWWMSILTLRSARTENGFIANSYILMFRLCTFTSCWYCINKVSCKEDCFVSFRWISTALAWTNSTQTGGEAGHWWRFLYFP